MIYKPQYSIFLICIFFIFISCEKKEVIVDEDPIILEGPFDETVTTTILSPHVNENYALKYFIPASYEENKKLPAIYVIDGIYMFDRVLSYTKNLDFDAIIVALGDQEFGNGERQRDFTPLGCGGSMDGYDNFNKLLSFDLIDFIENKYEYDTTSRTFIGWSFGGMFAIHNLINEYPNNKFQNYIAVDASECSKSQWGTLIENIEFTNINKKFNLYMSRGALFLPLNLEWLIALFDAKDHPSLDIQYFEYPNLDHEEIWKPTITEGLKHIYKL